MCLMTCSGKWRNSSKVTDFFGYYCYRKQTRTERRLLKRGAENFWQCGHFLQDVFLLIWPWEAHQASVRKFCVSRLGNWAFTKKSDNLNNKTQQTIMHGIAFNNYFWKGVLIVPTVVFITITATTQHTFPYHIKKIVYKWSIQIKFAI